MSIWIYHFYAIENATILTDYENKQYWLLKVTICSKHVTPGTNDYVVLII